MRRFSSFLGEGKLISHESLNDDDHYVYHKDTHEVHARVSTKQKAKYHTDNNPDLRSVSGMEAKHKKIPLRHKDIKEEMAVNNVSAGKVAGLDNDPPVKKNRKNYAFTRRKVDQ